MEDKISKDGKRAKCAQCGTWYGLDEAHGLYSSPECVAALLVKNLRRQIAAAGIDGSDLASVREMAFSVGRGADWLEDRGRAVRQA